MNAVDLNNALHGAELATFGIGYVLATDNELAFPPRLPGTDTAAATPSERQLSWRWLAARAPLARLWQRVSPWPQKVPRRQTMAVRTTTTTP